MEYLDGMDAQRFQYLANNEQQVSGSDTLPAMTHLFEMGEKCLMEEYDDKGDVTSPFSLVHLVNHQMDTGLAGMLRM